MAMALRDVWWKSSRESVLAEFILRPAAVADGEALCAFLIALGTNNDHPGVLPMRRVPTAAGQGEWIQGYLDGGGHVLLLFDADRVLGCAELTVGKAPYRHHCAALGVSLLKEARGQGHGTSMMKALQAWAERQDGLERIQLEVFHTNPGAIRLYERLGYVHEGRRVGAIKHEGESIDMIQMSLAL